MKPAKVCLFLLCLFGFTGLKAQTNFLSGYYVTAKMDTVRGYIECLGGGRNYRLCVFKKDLNAKPVTLHPEGITGFTVQDKAFYESHTFKNRNGEELVGFFRLVIMGKLSLLQHQSRYFARNSNNEMFEISKRSEVVTENELRTDFYGLGIMKVLMKDCPDMVGAYLEREYMSNPDFHKIFMEYNRCAGSPIHESKKIIVKPYVDLGVQVSPSYTKLNLSFLSDQNATFGNDLSLGVGGFVSFFVPRISEKVRLVAEGTFGKYKQYSYFSVDNTNNDLFIDYSFLKIPLFIRYGGKRFFFDVGIQNQFILSQTAKWRIETVQQNTVSTSDGKLTPLTSGRTTGILLGIGAKYKVYDHTLRSSLRFSRIQDSGHPERPLFQSLELVLSVQLTK